MRIPRASRLTSPPRYVIAAVIASTGGVLNGLDTGVIDPITTMSSFTDEFGHPSPAIHGMIVSSILLSMAITSLFAGSISDNLGRTRAIALGALLYAIGATIEAGARILGVFLFGRLVAGVGEGFFLSTLVVYICEISAANHRGLLASLIQFFITSGLVMGYFSCYGTVSIQSSFSWRFPVAMQSGIALFLTVASLFYLPESPRWLFHHGHGAAVEAACIRLGISIIETDNLVEREEHSHGHRNEEESSTLGARLRKNYKHSIHNLRLVWVLDHGSRRFWHAPLLFKQAGLSSSTASFLASGVPAILLCLASVPGSLYADKIGRRASALYGGSILAAIMALIGSLTLQIAFTRFQAPADGSLSSRYIYSQ
ncbi:hypothetical protein PAAG_00061 [Paracoccidioides lutzii Pb01]|uniref:Major facilitator superfamily (MFS) profile domain-containing protein n=1 Tax=Paracoccidioides lutzii (strain ATCC MYA-826 / Pb01) TaxID=502779 RepID=C1GNG6_PARBA|nr:hypothetical protein PAAG_00061 [Paracoccidioides lutzii Pb01]EEH35738.2 hypothetical protein PAAG_00061 [Paracoccidioides lutzii Pb01]